MQLPPLYKYLDVRGAELTLRNRTFKFSKPSDFNDTEELTLRGLFPTNIETALQELSSNFLPVILQNLDAAPTIGRPDLRMKLEVIQRALLSRPSLVKEIESEASRTQIYDLDTMRYLAIKHLNELHTHMKDFRVLCATTHRNSEYMWSRYAEDHRGIALRIEANSQKDSKFSLFRPVMYRENRPALYEDTSDFLRGALFGDLYSRTKQMMDKIIYTKTLEWSNESEYRLAIPLMPGEASWETDRYHPEEITELYLGAEMDVDSRIRIEAMAKAINPTIKIYRCDRSLSEPKLV